LEVVACCDSLPEKAEVRSKQFDIPSRTLDDILTDPSIEMVVVLTPAPTHYDIIHQALLAGKHVYTEKTMTLTLTQAQNLIHLAETKGLYLGSAPDTFLGAALQKARQLVDSGSIGEITAFQVASNRNLDRLTSKFTFLRMPGGGICYDYGVYYLTALVSLLGPISSVAAIVENRKPIRTNINPDSKEYGMPFNYDNEGQVTALLRTASGISGTFLLSGESISRDQAVFTLYGTSGILKLTNPNYFGGELVLIPEGSEPQIVENDLPYAENSRGIGPSDMADAIHNNLPNRASKEMAFHVLDVIESIMQSSKTKTFVDIASDCKLPLPLHRTAD